MLILKGVNASGEWRVASGEKNLGGGVAPLSRVFAYEWQGKDLRDTECVRVAGKGLTGGHFCASVQRSPPRGTPTRCFGKRGCKLLKRKDASRKRRAKRLQKIEGPRVRAGVTGGVGEVSSRYHGQPYRRSRRFINSKL